MRTATIYLCTDATDVAATAKVVGNGSLLISESNWALYVVDKNGNAVVSNAALATTGTAGLVKKGAVVANLTDSSGGSVSPTLAAIGAGATYLQSDQVAIKNAIASLNKHVNDIYTSLKNAGSVT